MRHPPAKRSSPPSLHPNQHIAIIFFNGHKSRSGGVFFVHTSLIYYGLHTNPSFGAGLPDFKRTYLRAQEELEKVLGIYIDRKKAALSIGEVSRVIRALYPAQLESAPFYSSIPNRSAGIRLT